MKYPILILVLLLFLAESFSQDVVKQPIPENRVNSSIEKMRNTAATLGTAGGVILAAGIVFSGISYARCDSDINCLFTDPLGLSTAFLLNSGTSMTIYSGFLNRQAKKEEAFQKQKANTLSLNATYLDKSPGLKLVYRF